jgi:hypothetical protein
MLTTSVMSSINISPNLNCPPPTTPIPRGRGLIEWEEKSIKWKLEVGTSILTCSHVTHVGVGVGMEDLIKGIPNFAEEEKRDRTTTLVIHLSSILLSRFSCIKLKQWCIGSWRMHVHQVFSRNSCKFQEKKKKKCCTCAFE